VAEHDRQLRDVLELLPGGVLELDAADPRPDGNARGLDQLVPGNEDLF
jgi:hypothetical protein